MTLGEELRSLRRKKGLTLSMVAAKAHTSLGYIHEIETGKATPSLQMLERLTDVYDAKVEIIHEEDQS